MLYTDLLKELLHRADAVRQHFGGETLCASHIVVAVADFCRTKYTGFAFSDYEYPRFEEERLRYLFSKEVKLKSYFQMRLSHNTKDGVAEEALDMSFCEGIAAERGADILSADTVFLCALARLHPSYQPTVRSVRSEDAILPLLQETDANIYDYVIENIAEIQTALQKKSREAAAIRDWKPAAKFAEPEALRAMFLEKIQKTTAGNVLTLKLPKFFGRTDLKLSFHQADGIYYVHDNGCALRHLSRQVTDKAKRTRILQKVCHICYLDGNRITGSFVQAHAFFYYLQMLVFIAHADLFYTKLEKQLYEKDKTYVYTKVSEPLNEAVLLQTLKNGIGFDYDENSGLSCCLDMRYSLGSGRAAYLLETLDGHVRISDKKKGRTEGEILEQFFWNHDHLADYSKFVSRFTERFGAELDGDHVYLTGKTEHFYEALVRFFNLAVLLSELGHHIALPKRGSK